MIVTTLGTGSILTDRLSSCFIVNRDLMIDVPNGSVKAARRAGFVPMEITALLVSHFHADHFFDIVFLLLELGLRNVRENDFIIVGPPGIEARTVELFDLAYPESRERVMQNSRAVFIEVLEGGESISIGDYVITPRIVKHTVETALGFEVSDSTTSVGFSGDSELCQSIRDICSNVSTAFFDTSFLTGRKGHMGLSDIKVLIEQHPGLRVIATHMSDEVSTLTGMVMPQIPYDGQEFTISAANG
ncbi:ribonuclease BN (tRNA processing enzyme) [Rathayibacter sp. PhB152]|uniref:MBL fold metallo-hydrolase n=1 Tax=Rathayibacter sp. PhB152 TaxID=2485190 RepID=UPI000F4B58C2|nr:MBL fold metallo-hydrolase [Rathayibacter sp. PhB152]ROQ54833.1 ribonuclease BN (tRNA processing enzyme) [Rathayibacter sp. PhB152]